MSQHVWLKEEEEQLRSALSLLEQPFTGGDTPCVELEPVISRFRIRGNASGLVRLASRSLRAALGENVEGVEPPDCSAWVILDDYRWVSGDLLLSEQSLQSMVTQYTLSSKTKIARKAALHRSLPWFAIGLLTTPAVYFLLAGIGIILGSFGIDIHLTR